MRQASIVLLSDIFGHTQALDTLANDLGVETQILSPYPRARPDFADEQQAYDYFSSQVGLKQYTERVELAVRCGKPCVVIGFSIGASVAWQLSSKAELGITSVIAYYGSQIRHFTHLQPSCKTKLVFPHSEPHFDVDTLAQQLTSKPNTQVRATPWNHGFMNPHSANFSLQAYREECLYLSLCLTTTDGF